MGGAVDAQLAYGHGTVILVFARAAQDGLDARQQLARRKGLDHVVVDPRFQAADPVVLLATRGQHDDRHVAGHFVAAPASGEFQTTGPGQHPVEQDQVRNPVGDGGGGLAAVPGVHWLVVALTQGEGHHVADGGLVIDYQDAFLHFNTVSSAGLGCK